MNNEEKILSMLEIMSGKIEKLTEKVDKLEEGQVRLEGDVRGLKEGQANLEREVRKTNLRIENEIMPGIQVLKEGQQGINEKLDVMAERIDEFEEKGIIAAVSRSEIKR